MNARCVNWSFVCHPYGAKTLHVKLMTAIHQLDQIHKENMLLETKGHAKSCHYWMQPDVAARFAVESGFYCYFSSMNDYLSAEIKNNFLRVLTPRAVAFP